MFLLDTIISNSERFSLNLCLSRLIFYCYICSTSSIFLQFNCFSDIFMSHVEDRNKQKRGNKQKRRKKGRRNGLSIKTCTFVCVLLFMASVGFKSSRANLVDMGNYSLFLFLPLRWGTSFCRRCKGPLHKCFADTNISM